MNRDILRTSVLSAVCLLAACATTSNGVSENTPSVQSTRPPNGSRPVENSQQAEFLQAEASNRPRTSLSPASTQIPVPAVSNPLPAPDRDANVYFSSGGSQIDESGKALLRRHAVRLKENPDLVVTLIGHSDPTGSRSYNLAITEEQINAVVQDLRSLGVPRWQIRRVNSGQGGTPISCRSIACGSQMQRVELVFSE